MTPNLPGPLDSPVVPVRLVAAGRERFAPECHIRRRADYLDTYGKGRKAVGRYFVVFQRPNASGTNRLGITVTRKTGDAVVRNRVRRRVREIFRRTGWARPVGTGLGSDVVVNVRDSVVAAPFDELERDLVRLLEKVARRTVP